MVGEPRNSSTAGQRALINPVQDALRSRSQPPQRRAAPQPPPSLTETSERLGLFPKLPPFLDHYDHDHADADDADDDDDDDNYDDDGDDDYYYDDDVYDDDDDDDDDDEDEDEDED